jgi:hypothetical protein
MSDLKEFAINLPMSSVPAMTASANTVPAAEPYDIMSSFALPPEIDTSACSHITVSCDSASVTNYNPDEPNVCVELVLSVNVRNDAMGSSSNYKLIKRLKMDKCKLAYEAESHTPVSVVEDQEDPLVVAQQMNEFYAARRARELSGLAESAGDKSAKVMFSFDADPGEGLDAEAASKARADKPGRNSATVTVKAIKDAAHARHVFGVKHAAKYPGAKITRVTMEDLNESEEDKEWGGFIRTKQEKK